MNTPTPKTPEEAEALVRHWRRKGLLPSDVEHILPSVKLRHELDRPGLHAHGQIAGHTWEVRACPQLHEGGRHAGWAAEDDCFQLVVQWDGIILEDIMVHAMWDTEKQAQRVAEALLRDHIRRLRKDAY